MSDKKKYDFSDFDAPEQKAYDFSDFDEQAETDKTVSDGFDLAKANPLPYIGGAGLTLGKSLANLVGGDFEGGASSLDDVSRAYKTNVQQLQDTQAGMAQGALLGGDDEIKGAVRALADKASGKNRNLNSLVSGDDRDIGSLYRKYQKMEEAKYNQAKERNPGSTLLGEVGGAVATGIVAGPALGIEAGIAKNLGSVGLKQAMKAGTGATLKELGKLGLAAGTEAAAFGAVQGGLSSDKTLDDMAGLGKDVASGATLGLIAGGVGKPATALGKEVVEGGINKAASALKAPFRKDKVLGEAFELGQTNAPVSEAEGSLIASADLRNKDAYGLFDKFKKVENQLGQEVDQAYKAADASGLRLEIADDLDEAAAKLQSYAKNRPDLGYENDREYKRVLDKLFLLKNTNPTALQADTLAKEVSQLAQNLKNPELSNIANRFGAQVDSQIKNVFPEIDRANSRFFNFKKFGTETFAQKGSVDSTMMKGFKKVEDQKVLSGIKWALENINSGDTAKVADTLSYAKEGLEALESKHPGTLKLLGLNSANDIESLFYDSARRTEVIKVLNDKFNFGTLLPKMNAEGAASAAVRGETPLLRAAKVKTAYGLGKVSNKLQNLSRDMAGMGNDKLQTLAEGFVNSGSPEAQKTGQALLNALQNKGTVTKNAAIFTILNSKSLRQQAGEILGYSEDENEQRE
jgi:hypothetical protein